MIIKILRLIVLFSLIISCGFKVINKNQLRNFDIVDVITSGDNRINFLLKKNLKSNKDRFNNKIKLNLETDKLKEIKEKNIKNEITKYRIQVIVDVEVNVDNFNITKRFNLSRNGDYNVANEQSRTISNQNNLEKYLANTIAEDVSDKIIFILNDI